MGIQLALVVADLVGNWLKSVNIEALEAWDPTSVRDHLRNELDLYGFSDKPLPQCLVMARLPVLLQALYEGLVLCFSYVETSVSKPERVYTISILRKPFYLL
jgi:hypothetical protein